MKPPLSVILVAALYILVGVAGLIGHFPREWHMEDVLIEATEVLAIVCGVYLLLAKNWARWLTVAWIAGHVALSFPAIGKVAVHSLFLVAIAYALFRAGTRRFFEARES